MLVCNTCGSDNVYEPKWVGVNDGDVVEGFSDDRYCGDCFAECELVEQRLFEERHQWWPEANQEH